MVDLDLDSFPAFKELLVAARPYAREQGCRFKSSDFAKPARICPPLPSPSMSDELQISIEICEESVKVFTAMLQAPPDANPELEADYQRAYILGEREAIKNAIIASFASAGSWPPKVGEAGDWTDYNAPLETIARRVWAEQTDICSTPEYHARIQTASFISDFGVAAGRSSSTTPEGAELLVGFLAKFERDLGEECTSIRVFKKRFAERFLENVGSTVVDQFNWATEEKWPLALAVGVASLALWARARKC